MKKQLKNALVAAVLLCLYACANIGSPTGGEKDVVAPVLVFTSPKNGQTNVNPEKIVLSFSEDIQAPELSRQLIIAPHSENAYKTKIKGGTIELTFEEPWEENTTYSLNFRKSITDITEKNPAQNVVLTFSTGNYLDSGQVTGNVSYVFDQKPPKDVSVLLYPTQDTSQVAKGKPLYVTQTDSTGNFVFNYIKRGNYHIYALEETNNNLRYDNEKESIAFLTDSISVETKVEGLSLKLHLQDKTKPMAMARKGYLDMYEVQYNEGLQKVEVNSLNQDSRVEAKWLINGQGKSLQLFPSVPEESKWRVEAQDSAGNVKVDTLTIRLSGARASRAIKSFQLANGSEIKPGDTLKLEFAVPTKIINPEGAVTIISDSATTVTTKAANELIFNQNQTVLSVLTPISATEKVEVQIDTTKIVPFIGLPYTSSTQQLQVVERTNVGSLKINLATEKPSFIVQLLKDQKVVRETRNQKTVLWENLQPGNYQIRILVDENQNGKWDNGDLETRKLPEPVILPSQKFDIRSNWDIVEENPIRF